MSKAEERALKAYPIKHDDSWNSHCRRLYISAYNQAEKDLKLTWDDVSLLNCLLNEVEHDFKKGVYEDRSYKGYCQEVLKRYKDLKK